MNHRAKLTLHFPVENSDIGTGKKEKEKKNRKGKDKENGSVSTSETPPPPPPNEISPPHAVVSIMLLK
jgi:translation initiation factor 5